MAAPGRAVTARARRVLARVDQIETIQGVPVPKLGFGTYELVGETAHRMTAAALRIGYRHIDTAQAYGNEAYVAAGIRESGVARGDIFLTTKVWMTNAAPKLTTKSAEQSLKYLQTDYVDLLLIHWPSQFNPVATLEAMLDLKAAGKVRNVGVSNFPRGYVEELPLAMQRKVFCDQVEFHATLEQDRLLDYVRKHDMLLTAYSPLAQGSLVKNRALAKIGAQYGKSASQVALRWLIEQSNVAAIPRSSSEARARENFNIFDFKLSDDDHRAIRDLPKDRRQVRPRWEPEWDA